MNEDWHDEEVDSPVEHVEGKEEKRKNIGGCPVKTQFELRKFGLKCTYNDQLGRCWSDADLGNDVTSVLPHF